KRDFVFSPSAFTCRAKSCGEPTWASQYDGGGVNFAFDLLKFARMSQLPLFRSERNEPQPRSSDPVYVRKSLNRLLRVAREAQIMPWSEGEMESWEKLFPELA